MIFENIAHITNKNAFLELINIYIRLVEVTAQRYNRTIPPTLHTNSFILSELEDMGIISDANQINALQFSLKKDYTRFISCVNFFLENIIAKTKCAKIENETSKTSLFFASFFLLASGFVKCKLNAD